MRPGPTGWGCCLTGREMLLADLLDRGGWADWRQTPFAGDASKRRYLRLESPDRNGSVIVMDASPDSGETVQPFVTIAWHLTGIGLAAPRILASDTAAGLLVLDDLGRADFAKWIGDTPDDEGRLYGAAVDTLIRMQAAPPPPGLTALTPAAAGAMVGVVSEWYAPGDTTGLQDAVIDAFSRLVDPVLVLSLRDFHAENLIWRPDRAGTDRVGLLDFQDAFLAHPAYDLASLLRDARRDVSADVSAAMIARFASATRADPAAFGATFACLAAQRNLRILGIFARLVNRDGKAKYAALMPRVWGHLTTDLAHPALSDLRALVRTTLPEPTGARR